MIGRTLGLYFGTRFLRSVALVFFTIFGLIYMVDFVEMLRRTSDKPHNGVLLIAYLCLLRAPSIAEVILPFSVLFGAMAGFFNLTRKLELVVARAAGVSVWQFLAPPLVGALAIGVFVVTAYSPAAAVMRQRADEIQATIFQTNLSSGSGVWIRQKSKDGQSIMHAGVSSKAGLLLADVSAYVFDRKGRFIERVDANQARLVGHAWRLNHATITAPGENPRLKDVYLLATNLKPSQVVQVFVAPDSAPFWSLPRIARDMQSAGLDAAGYRLRFQSLLALPFLLAAMVLIAASFSLKLSRMGGVGMMVLGGVGAGFVLYVASKLVSDLGEAGLLSTSVAAWSPAVVANMLGALALLNREDG